MLWNIHEYHSKSAAKETAASFAKDQNMAKQNIARYVFPACAHHLPVLSNDAASGWIRGSSDALVRLSTKNTANSCALRMDLFGSTSSTSALTAAFRGLEKQNWVEACPSLSMSKQCEVSVEPRCSAMKFRALEIVRYVQTYKMDNNLSLSAARKRK